MLSELQVLQDVCRRLEEVGIRYMLTDSMAMSYYAQPRMTRDIDLVVEVDPAQADMLALAFTPDYYVPREYMEDSIRVRGMFNLLHLESVVKVDMIVRKEEPYRQAEFERRAKVAFPGFEAWIASKEDLILSKLIWAREGDSDLQLRDARNLLGTGADFDYLRGWAARLGVNKELEEALDERHGA